jgi:hypothetical protein
MPHTCEIRDERSGHVSPHRVIALRGTIGRDQNQDYMIQEWRTVSTGMLPWEKSGVGVIDGNQRLAPW